MPLQRLQRRGVGGKRNWKRSLERAGMRCAHASKCSDAPIVKRHTTRCVNTKKDKRRANQHAWVDMHFWQHGVRLSNGTRDETIQLTLRVCLGELRFSECLVSTGCAFRHEGGSRTFCIAFCVYSLSRCPMRQSVSSWRVRARVPMLLFRLQVSSKTAHTASAPLISLISLAAATERRSGASQAPSGPAGGAAEPPRPVRRDHWDVRATRRRCDSARRSSSSRGRRWSTLMASRRRSSATSSTRLWGRIERGAG